MCDTTTHTSKLIKKRKKKRKEKLIQTIFRIKYSDYILCMLNLFYF